MKLRRKWTPSDAIWIEAANRSFQTVAADHANCSVGSYTHGFISLGEAAKRGDVEALIVSNWVNAAAISKIENVKRAHRYVSYGPLGEFEDVDVILLRISGKQMMPLHDACPEIRFEGKPRCHILAIAKEENAIAISTGCMLSRVRTGMSNQEVTCAIPQARLSELIASLRAARDADHSIAEFAARDKARFVEGVG